MLTGSQTALPPAEAKVAYRWRFPESTVLNTVVSIGIEVVRITVDSRISTHGLNVRVYSGPLIVSKESLIAQNIQSWVRLTLGLWVSIITSFEMAQRVLYLLG